MLLPTPLPLQYSLHIFGKQNVLKTLKSPFSLQHICCGSTCHIIHTKLSYLFFMLHSQHGTTLLLDQSPFVMLPLTITLVLPRLAFKPLLSKASFYSMNLFMNPLIVSLIMTESSAYINSLNAPSLANSLTTSTTTARRKEHRALVRPYVDLKLL